MTDKSPESDSLQSVLNPTNHTEPEPSEDESGSPSLKEDDYQPHV